jgi:hypothetical protein
VVVGVGVGVGVIFMGELYLSVFKGHGVTILAF